MKNLLTIFFICISSIANCQWIWQNPLPTSENLHRIHFVNENVGYILGFNGSICKTINGGITWNVISYDTNLILSGGLFFLNEQKGFITNSNSIYTTLNGGVNWSQTLVSGNPGFGEISFSDENKGLISARAGMVYKTYDGGNNWSPSYVGFAFDLTTINHVSGGIFYAGSSEGKIFKTTDYGDYWEFQTLDTTEKINNIDFVNFNTGYAFCDYGIYYKTTNAGNNWTQSNAPSLSSDSKGLFINDNTGFICGIRYNSGNNYGAIAKTTNGGLNWLIDYFHNTWWLRDIFKINNFIYTCGYYGKIYKTSTMGLNWFELSEGNSSIISEIEFFNSQRGIAVGYDGNIALTTNGGLNWNLKELDTIKSNYFDVSFSGENNVIVTGWYGRIYKSTDGGENWLKLTFDSNLNFTDVNFLNSNLIYASAAGNGLYKSTNGGLNWIVINNSGIYLSAIFFINENTGFASGNFNGVGNLISKTTDGGQTFIPKITPTNTLFFDFDFINDNTGWCAGYKTTDGGENWINTLHIQGFRINAISFVNENTGYASGYYPYHGRVLFTTNGGNTWNFQQELYNGMLFSVHFIDHKRGFIGGGIGGLLRTTNGGGVVGVMPLSTNVQTDFKLYQNYPNPFNPSTIIQYSLPKELHVKIKIYDISGREVDVLVNELKTQGIHYVNFDGSRFSSGIYFYRIITDNFIEAKRMVLIK